MTDGPRLVSHGWVKRCRVCEQQSHAKWHEYAQCEANPIVVIQCIESYRHAAPEVCDKIVRFIAAITGMDMDAMRTALAAEAAQDKILHSVDWDHEK